MTWEELNTHDLAVYSTSWCSDCRRLEQYLAKENISYRDIDIDKDEEAAKHLQEKTNRTAIPFVEIDGNHMVRGWHAEKPGKWDAELFLKEVEEALRK